jgi:hypothetical protein
VAGKLVEVDDLGAILLGGDAERVDSDSRFDVEART